MVGTTAEHLESVKELIVFDHMYYKSDQQLGCSADSNEQSICTHMDTPENKMESTTLVFDEDSIPIESVTYEICSEDSPSSLGRVSTDDECSRAEDDDDDDNDVLFLGSVKPNTVPSIMLTKQHHYSPVPPVNSIAEDSTNNSLLKPRKKEMDSTSGSDSDYESVSSLLSPFSDQMCHSPFGDDASDSFDASLVELFPSLI